MKVLVDADIITYQVASMAERQIDWGDGDKTISLSSEEDVIKKLNDRIAEISAVLNVDPVQGFVFAFSCPSKRYFRHDLWPDYKAHRSGRVAPTHLKFVREYVKSNYTTKHRPGLEADDILGIMADLYRDKFDFCIVSSDKDLDQIPGLHYNPSKQDSTYIVTEEYAKTWHMTQTLIGDSADNYPGCKGIGPVKARAIVEGGWPAVFKAFKAAGLTKKYAMIQARIARILRASDWNDKTHTVRLWSPNRKEKASNV